MVLLCDEPILGGMHICRPNPVPIQRGEEQGFTLVSDLHIGAPQVDYRLIEKERDVAIERKDRISINGDIYDAILPKDHKRFKPDAIHPRLYGRSDVLNALVEWGIELLAPAAHLIDMIGVGNHDTSVEKYHSFDPVRALVYELQKIASERDPGHLIHYGGYTGFIDYRLRPLTFDGEMQGGGDGEKCSGSRRWVIYYHHGSGGAAPVTKGMIDFNRRDTFVDADLLWLGHKHNRWNGAVQKLSCPMGGDQPNVKDVRHVMTGAYFKTYVGQSQASVREHGRRSNYAADAGFAPQGMGGARVSIRLVGKDNVPEIKVTQ